MKEKLDILEPINPPYSNIYKDSTALLLLYEELTNQSHIFSGSPDFFKDGSKFSGKDLMLNGVIAAIFKNATRVVNL